MTYNPPGPDAVPVPVHLTGSEIQLGGQGAAPSCKSVYRTVTLTVDDPAQEIMGASDNREIAQVIAVDADIYINDNLSDVKAGKGAYIPCVTPSSAKPNLNGPVPVQDYRVIYAAPVTTLTGSNVARVTVISVYRD